MNRAITLSHFLPAGDYLVTATLGGFREARAERVTLQVLQTARVDFQMQPGNVNERVEVSAAAALLQTENATVGTVIDSSKIVDLPLNGRNFIQLAQLIPGVQAGTPGSITVRRGRGSVGQTDPSYGSTAASANGPRDTANRFFIDGIESMDYDAMTYSFSPSVDSLAEFKVETSTYSAESGGAPGGQVNMITKTRHQPVARHALGIQSQRSAHAELRRHRRQERRLRRGSTATSSAPTSAARSVIPKLYNGTDKTFFFFNWESGYAAAGRLQRFRIVPTAAHAQRRFQRPDGRAHRAADRPQRSAEHRHRRQHDPDNPP